MESLRESMFDIFARHCRLASQTVKKIVKRPSVKARSRWRSGAIRPPSHGKCTRAGCPGPRRCVYQRTVQRRLAVDDRFLPLRKKLKRGTLCEETPGWLTRLPARIRRGSARTLLTRSRRRAITETVSAPEDRLSFCPEVRIPAPVRMKNDATWFSESAAERSQRRNGLTRAGRASK